ncbi:MAG: N-acetylmuramoyl-L-alanine amidase [Fibrobacter sp.]|nr:N-acetylmuramoyl-L-alanine amidase [Fibrobacter sp.]
MRPETIKKREDEFFSTLTNSAGIKYKLTGTVDIGNDVKIYSIRPDYDSYYYTTKTKTKKQSICLHFTVGYIKSDTTALTTKDNYVSVSYVVDRCGRIYELFPDTMWSYHLGSGTVGGNGAMSKQTIGIEISNYGPLKSSGDNLLIDIYKNEYCKKSETEYYYAQNFRGYEYFASMTDVQVNAVAALVKYLGRKHDIPMNFKPDDALFASDAEAKAFKGIFYHTNVRKDKFDWPFGPPIKAIISACSDVLPPKAEAAPDATAKEAPAPLEVKKSVELSDPPEAEKPAETEAPKNADVAPATPAAPATATPAATASAAPAVENVATAPEADKPAAAKLATAKPASAKTKSSALQALISLFARLFGGKK